MRVASRRIGRVAIDGFYAADFYIREIAGDFSGLVIIPASAVVAWFEHGGQSVGVPFLENRFVLSNYHDLPQVSSKSTRATFRLAARPDGVGFPPKATGLAFNTEVFCAAGPELVTACGVLRRGVLGILPLLSTDMLQKVAD